MTYRGTVHVRAHWRRLYPRGQHPPAVRTTYRSAKRKMKARAYR